MQQWMEQAYRGSSSSSKQALTKPKLQQSVSKPASVVITSSAQASNSGHRGSQLGAARSADGETVACQSEARPTAIIHSAAPPKQDAVKPQLQPQPKPAQQQSQPQQPKQQPKPHTQSQPKQQPQQSQQLPTQPPLQRAEKVRSAAVAPSGDRNLPAAQSKSDAPKQSSSKPQPAGQSSSVQPPPSSPSSSSAPSSDRKPRLWIDRFLPRHGGPRDGCNPLTELLAPESSVTVGEEWKMQLILAALKGRLDPEAFQPKRMGCSRKFNFEPKKPKDRSKDKDKHRVEEEDVTIVKHKTKPAAAATKATTHVKEQEEQGESKEQAAVSKAKKKREKQKLAKQKQAAVEVQ